MTSAHKGITVSELVLFGILGAMCFLGKFLMAGLPNIEPVSLLVILFAVTFGRKALYPIYTYVLLEFVVYGFNLWSINYLYIWLILAIVAWCLRSCRSPLVWALVSGCFGLAFGALCAPVYLFTGGWAFALTWWVSGIPFDLLHAAGNFVIALALFKPLQKLMESLYARLIRH